MEMHFEMLHIKPLSIVLLLELGGFGAACDELQTNSVIWRMSMDSRQHLPDCYRRTAVPTARTGSIAISPGYAIDPLEAAYPRHLMEYSDVSKRQRSPTEMRYSVQRVDR